MARPSSQKAAILAQIVRTGPLNRTPMDEDVALMDHDIASPGACNGADLRALGTYLYNVAEVAEAAEAAGDDDVLAALAPVAEAAALALWIFWAGIIGPAFDALRVMVQAAKRAGIDLRAPSAEDAIGAALGSDGARALDATGRRLDAGVRAAGGIARGFLRVLGPRAARRRPEPRRGRVVRRARSHRRRPTPRHARAPAPSGAGGGPPPEEPPAPLSGPRDARRAPRGEP